MRKIIAALALLISLHAHGQDYVITLKNDTLRGEVRILTFDVIDKVEIKEGKKKQILTAIQVKSISVGGKIYRPVRVVEGYKMMQLVKPGFLSILLGRRENNMDYEVQYIVRLDGAALEIPNIGFKKNMKDFLSDCPILSQKIEEGKLGRKNVEQIVDEYNLCLDKARSREVSTIPAETTVVTEDPRLVALAELKAVLQKLSFNNQKDALDIVGDLSEKVRNKQAIPRYLIESLKGLLKDVPDTQSATDKVLSLVKAE
jgi:hypothetical protein